MLAARLREWRFERAARELQPFVRPVHLSVLGVAGVRRSLRLKEPTRRGLVDRDLDRLGRADGEPDRDARLPSDVVEARRLGGIGDDDEQGSVGEDADRKRRVLACDLLGNASRDRDDRVRALEVDERELVLLGHEARHLRARDETVLDERLSQAAARDAASAVVALQRQETLKLLDADEAVANEEHAQCGPGKACRLHYERPLMFGTYRLISRDGLAPVRIHP